MIKKIPVFMSVGTPHSDVQKAYLESLSAHLGRRGLLVETLGKTFWSNQSPLIPIREKMEHVFGAVVLAMERFHSTGGRIKEGATEEQVTSHQYFATCWNQIEGAMAYQLNLPLLILKEEKLIDEGIFDSKIHDWFVFSIHPEDSNELKRNPLKGSIDRWIEQVQEYQRLTYKEAAT